VVLAAAHRCSPHRLLDKQLQVTLVFTSFAIPSHNFFASFCRQAQARLPPSKCVAGFHPFPMLSPSLTTSSLSPSAQGHTA
jgi:hypothetical protein